MGKLSQVREAIARQKAAAAMRGRSQSSAPPTPIPTAPSRPTSTRAERRTGGPPDRLTHSCGHHTTLAHLAAQPCDCCRGKGRRQRGKRAVPQLKDRLPGGSAFEVVYDAATRTWTGTLTVPGAGTFRGSAGAVFALLQQLDDQFRVRQRAPEHPTGGG